MTTTSMPPTEPDPNPGNTGSTATTPTPPTQPAPPRPATPTQLRPRRTHGITERIRTGHGNIYVTINFDPEEPDQQRPFEVFASAGKAGGCDSAQLEAISRLASLALRSGIAVDLVIEQLQGITCCPSWDEGTLVRSGPDAIALALSHVAGAETNLQTPSPSGSIQLQFVEQPAPPAQPAPPTQPVTNPAQRCPDCNSNLAYQEAA